MAESRDDKFVQRLDFKDSSGLSANWKTFKSQFEIIKIAKKYADMTEEEQVANLLLLMGPDSVRIYNQFTFNENQDDTKKTLANVIRFFDAHFEPVKNVIYERVKFNDMRQGNLSIHQFITEVQTQADNCDYGEMRDQLIRDRIVVGVRDQKLREYLIDLEDLTLLKAIQKAKQYVAHHSSVLQMGGHASANDNVDEVKARSTKENTRASGGRQGMHKQKCPYCDRRQTHTRERCPARNATCFVCKQKGHYSKAAACKVKQTQPRAADEVVEEEELGDLYLGSDST